MKFNDAVSGAVLLALALAVLVNVQSFPKIPGQNIGPGAFPGLLAALLAGCAIVLIIKGLQRRKHANGTASAAVENKSPVEWFTAGAWLQSPPQLRNFAVTVGSLLFYIAASDWLGFIPCAIIVLVAMFLTLGVRHRLILPIAVVVALVIHWVFYKGLRVPLPWGVLLPYAW